MVMPPTLPPGLTITALDHAEAKARTSRLFPATCPPTPQTFGVWEPPRVGPPPQSALIDALCLVAWYACVLGIGFAVGWCAHGAPLPAELGQ